MKQKYIFCFYLVIYSLICSCGFDESEDKEKTSLQEIRPQRDQESSPTLNIEVLFEREPLSDEKIFITDIKDGDELEIEITGHYKRPSFSEIYTRKSIATWKNKFCIPYNDQFYYQRKKSATESCILIDAHGECSSSFRDYKGEVKDKVKFEKVFIDPRISYFIGNKEYFFNKNSSDDKYVFKSKITFNKENIKRDQSFYIKSYPDLTVSVVKVGFLEFLDCGPTGKNAINFNPNISTTSYETSNIRTFNYSLSVKKKSFE